MRLLLSSEGLEALSEPLPREGPSAPLLHKLQAQLMGNMLMVSPDDQEELETLGETDPRVHAVLEGAEKG
jgi:hypothetical protein